MLLWKLIFLVIGINERKRKKMKFYLFNLIDFVGEDKFDEMTDKVIDITKQ